MISVRASTTCIIHMRGLPGSVKRFEEYIIIKIVNCSFY